MTSSLFKVAQRAQRWTYFTWYWGDAIAVDGLLETGRVGDPTAQMFVSRQLRHWADAAPDNLDDPLAPGKAIVELVAAGDLEERALDRFVTAVDRLPKIEHFPLLEPHRPRFRFGICIDAVYHLPPALAAYGRLVSDEQRVVDAVRMALQAIDALACPSGWAQWYDHGEDRNNGIAWSRGVGWALLGLLDLLTVAEGADGCDRVEHYAAAMLDRLATTQGANGDWAAVLDDSQAPSEASTAAFFVAAALHPRARPIWTAPAEVLAAAVESVERSVDADGVVRGVSADILPSWDLEAYRRFGVEPSPWAQGAALRALAALAPSR